MTGSEQEMGAAMKRYLPDTLVEVAVEAEEDTRLWAVPTGGAGTVPVYLDRPT